MSALHEYDRLWVVLVSTRNPLNIGAAARAMSNFGFLRLRVVNPYDPAFREARSAVGASSVLADAEQFASLAEAVADCTLVVGTTATGQREIKHPLHNLADGGTLIRGRMLSGQVALLFGSEKTGLSVEDLSHCHCLIHIPTRDEHLSMNLGQAVAVCLYEIARGGITAAESNEKMEDHASAAHLDRVTGVLLEALQSSGYISQSGPVDVDQRVRRLILRMKMCPHDAEIWLGMLRQIVWKLQSHSSNPS